MNKKQLNYVKIKKYVKFLKIFLKEFIRQNYSE